MNQVELNVCERPSDLHLGLNKLKEMHQLYWQAKGKPGAFIDDRFKRFHLKVSQRLNLTSNTVFFTLSKNKQVFAAFYGFKTKDTLFYYQSGIDYAQPTLSPGVLMHYYAIILADKLGLHNYSFMKGEEGGYKSMYTSNGVLLYSSLIMRPMSSLCLTLQRIWEKFS